MTGHVTPRRLRTDAGLTILELMIVLVILSLIGVVVSFQIVGQMDRAKVDVAKLQLRQLQGALALFALDTHRYPNADEGLSALLKAPESLGGWRGPYVKNNQMLADPWGESIRYELLDAGGYLLTSLGADRKAGGDGAAAELALGDRD